MRKLEKKIFITYELELLTGLHIGDSKEKIEIGGVDNPVVRRKDNNEPYIPGSSIKGKLRCLLDQVYGVNPSGDCRIDNYKDDSKVIAELFGASSVKDKEGIPSRLIVRDAYLTKEWAEKLKNSEFTDMPYTEIKWENVIDRIKGVAEHPRQMERIPAGARFELQLVINIFKDDDEKKLLELLKKGINLLEDDYLGGSGSRGYGQVKIHELNTSEKLASEYMA